MFSSRHLLWCSRGFIVVLMPPLRAGSSCIITLSMANRYKLRFSGLHFGELCVNKFLQILDLRDQLTRH